MPNSKITVLLLAQHSGSKIVQRKLMELHPSWQATSALVANTNLNPEIWSELYKNREKLSSSERTLLLHNAPTATQARHALATENGNHLLDLLELGARAMDAKTKVALYESNSFDEQHAARMLVTGDVPPGYEQIFFAMVLDSIITDARTRRYSSVMEAVATRLKILTKEQLLKQLKCDPIAHYEMARIIDYYPELISGILKAGGQLLKDSLPAMAVSQHLTQELAAQILRPTLSTEGYKLEANGYATLTNLARNPNAATHTRISSVDAVLLINSNAKNLSFPDSKIGEELASLRSTLPEQEPVTHPWSSLTPSGLPKVKAAIISYENAHYYPTLANVDALKGPVDSSPAHFISIVLTPRLDVAGEQAWDIYLSLLPDWDGSEQELLDATLGALIR